MTSRTKAIPLQNIGTISVDEHKALQDVSAADPLFWRNVPDEHKAAYAKYKKEVKAYYYGKQGRRCCYCSIELTNHQATYDYEHVLDISHHPQFSFAPNNAAVACKPCNGFKSTKEILVVPPAEPLTQIPSLSDAYSIVHPHLDEWSDHFEYDAIGRITPDSTKGDATIRICGMSALNIARLADAFAENRTSAETTLRDFFELENNAERGKYLDFLEELAAAGRHAGAIAIAGQLRRELDQAQPPLGTD